MEFDNTAILETAFVQQHLARALEVGVARYRDQTAGGIRSNILCISLGSPLEAAFLAWCFVIMDGPEWPPCSLRCQVEIPLEDVTYRADFVIGAHDDDWLRERCAAFRLVYPQFAVELDGHDFHERTRAQVATRDRRDRQLLASHWRVLHFSGSEFHQHPQACVEEALATVEAAYSELRRLIWAQERAQRTPEQVAKDDAVMTELFGAV